MSNSMNLYHTSSPMMVTGLNGLSSSRATSSTGVSIIHKDIDKEGLTVTASGAIPVVSQPIMAIQGGSSLPHGVQIIGLPQNSEGFGVLNIVPQ